jgi:hypothetical protein
VGKIGEKCPTPFYRIEIQATFQAGVRYTVMIWRVINDGGVNGL